MPSRLNKPYSPEYALSMPPSRIVSPHPHIVFCDQSTSPTYFRNKNVATRTDTLVPIDAVIFDLFDTLIPGGSRSERDALSRQIADDLGVEPEPFAALIRDTFDDRTRGRLGGVRETLGRLAAELDASPTPTALDAAVERRLALTRMLHAQTWAIPALTELQAAGVQIGLVSDCSAETPEIWSRSPISPFFAATSFSCETGLRKPDPEAYMVTVRALNVSPTRCFYVGDGGSNELNGASALGMTVYRYAPAAGQSGDAVGAAPNWSGPAISDLLQLTGLMRA